MTTSASSGDLLKRWRTVRRISQLDLAATADVSQRHLSFLETGRANPSREMIIHLASVLEVPLRDRNRWLTAAGYASMYTEYRIEEPAMDQVRHVLTLILDAHAPFPAYVVDRTWTLVMTNEPAAALTASLVSPDLGSLFQGNILKLVTHPQGMRSAIVNWDDAAGALIHRLQREISERPGDEALQILFDEIRAYPDVGRLIRSPNTPTGRDLLVPFHIRSPIGDMRFLTTISTIGAPFDVTLEELRLEALLPADAETEAILRSLAM
jgi:transcriptional regulator with XRE-family HTH domain